ncbi:MAG: hypothetical protein ACP5VS_08615 [Desulfomonilaceae bacterium]
MNMIFVRRILFLVFLVGLYLSSAIAQEKAWNTQNSTSNFPRLETRDSTRLTRTNSNVLIHPRNNGFTPAPQGQFPCFPQCYKTNYSEPSAYLGYLYRDHGATLQMQFDGTATTPTQPSFTRNDFDLQGIWLEFALPMTIGQNIGLMLSGAHLFSLQPGSVQSYDTYNETIAARQWNPDVHWWEVNTAGSYQIIPSLIGIMGFRWTSFSVNFNNPRKQVGFAPNADSATLSANVYVPFLGMLMEGNLDCRSIIKMAAYGFPLLPGNIVYTETASLMSQPTGFSDSAISSAGYFLEAFTEYSMKRDMWTMGGFVRFTEVRMERTVGGNVGGVYMPVDINFDRSNWIFGGKLGYVF